MSNVLIADYALLSDCRSAAPTTSLPESIGGERNWDYCYTWIRDASLTLEALWVAACPDEASWFFAWMAGAVAAQLRRGAQLQIMFGVGGEHDLSERTLSHLAGWRASRPVRVGNGAWNHGSREPTVPCPHSQTPGSPFVSSLSRICKIN